MPFFFFLVFYTYVLLPKLYESEKQIAWLGKTLTLYLKSYYLERGDTKLERGCHLLSWPIDTIWVCGLEPITHFWSFLNWEFQKFFRSERYWQLSTFTRRLLLYRIHQSFVHMLYVFVHSDLDALYQLGVLQNSLVWQLFINILNIIHQLMSQTLWSSRHLSVVPWIWAERLIFQSPES